MEDARRRPDRARRTTKGRLAPARGAWTLPPKGGSYGTSVSGTSARGAAVRALVARTAAHHDRAARRAGRRVFLVLYGRERRGLSRPARLEGRAYRCIRYRLHVERQLLRRRDGHLFTVVHAGAELRFGRQELRGHPAEDVVDDRLR